LNLRSNRTHAHESGISVLEFAITLAIIGILVVIMIPSFESMLRSNRIERLADELTTHLHQARVHAIETSKPVIICPRKNNGCGSIDDWINGWIVFEDSVTINSSHDKDEEILQEKQLAPNGENARVTINYVKSQPYIRYTPDGHAWPYGAFKICSSDESIDSSTVVVNVTGRSRIGSVSEAILACK
jgi:type IV fimbrial biogenesis protein FimT